MLAKLFKESPAMYGAVPPSDVEDQQGSDYGDHDEYRHEEDVPLLSSKSIRRPSWLPLLVCICISLTGLALKLSFYLYSSSDEAAAFYLLTNRSAATHEHLHTFETASGGSVSLYKVQWEDKPGHQEETYVCHLQSVCISREGDLQSGSSKKQYWLMGHADEERTSIAELDKSASDAFKACLGHPDSDVPSYTVGIKNIRKYRGEVSWVHGCTFALPKYDAVSPQEGASLLWLKAWSRYLSLSINASPAFLRDIHLTTKHFFHNVLLLDQEAEMSHWEETIFGTAQTASYAAITRPQLANETLSISKLPVRDAAWVGRHMPEPSIWGEETLGFDEATCLANLIIVQPSKQFFRDRDDAAYFRSWVLNDADMPQNRSIPTHLKDLKAVLVLRPDRPMWDHKEIVRLLNETGIHDIQVTAITETTSEDDFIDLWSNADIVITDDHDSLTGQTLMRPGAGVIEVFPPLMYNDAHSMLASKTGVHYIPATTSSVVSADIVHAEEPDAMPKLDRARKLADTYSTEDACKAAPDCQQAMYDVGAYIEDAHLKAAVRELLRRMAPPHSCMQK